MKKILFLLSISVVLFFIGACESEAPLEGNDQRSVDTLFIINYDTIVKIDTTFSYDSIFVFDTTFSYDTLVIIDTLHLPDDTLVYEGCLKLKCNTKIGTLGEPGRFVTISRSEVNGHAIQFCLYVYKRNEVYFGVLSATHLKTEWPAVTARVEASNNEPISWYLDSLSQTRKIVF